MIFDRIRKDQKLKLAALFAFAASTPFAALPREEPEVAEFRILAQHYDKHPHLMSERQFARFADLYKQLRNQPQAQGVLNGSGFCAHGGGNGTGGAAGGATAAVCPITRRRMAEGDMSHLLAITHWV